MKTFALVSVFSMMALNSHFALAAPAPPSLHSIAQVVAIANGFDGLGILGFNGVIESIALQNDGTYLAKAKSDEGKICSVAVRVQRVPSGPGDWTDNPIYGAPQCN
jgi:hypothetical protein